MHIARCRFKSTVIVAAVLGAALVPSSTGAVPPPNLSVSTVMPANGQQVSGTITWEVSVTGGVPNRVEFDVDGNVKGTDSSAPYVFNLDGTTLSAGTHSLTATAFANSGRGRKASSTISIVVPKPATVTATTTNATSTSSSIYWGAFMDGNDTYGSGYGDAPWDSNTWNLFESHVGKKVSIVHWGNAKPWDLSFNYFLSMYQKVLGRGDLSLISLNSGSVPLRDLAAGKYDSSLKTWVAQAKAWGHPFFLRWDWEMNGGWFSWGTTSKNQNAASDYVNAWKHFHNLAVEAGASNITWVWCPNREFSGSTPLEQLYPGDAYVDWTCLDGYNKGGSEWRSFSTIFTTSYNHVLQLAPTKPIMIAETSSEESGGSKASWITDALATQVPKYFPGVKAVVWMNWRLYENNRWWPWPVESSASARTAFTSAIASSYYLAGGSLGGLPLLSKIKPF
jgi:hypothetical protein